MARYSLDSSVALRVKMWERGEQERVTREEKSNKSDTFNHDKEQDKGNKSDLTVNREEEKEKTINSPSFDDTIRSFEQIFTLEKKKEKFKNRDLKRTNTIDKFDEIFDEMDLSQRSSADTSISIEFENSIEDDENDQTIRSDDHSIVEATKVHEESSDLTKEIFNELESQKSENDGSETKSKSVMNTTEKDHSSEELQIESHPIKKRVNGNDEVDEESENKANGASEVVDGICSFDDDLGSSGSELRSEIDSSKKASRSSSGSPVPLLQRSPFAELKNKFNRTAASSNIALSSKLKDHKAATSGRSSSPSPVTSPSSSWKFHKAEGWNVFK